MELQRNQQTKFKFVNFSMPEDLYSQLMEMGADNRSAFIRRLIRQEWNRRQAEKATPVKEVTE